MLVFVELLVVRKAAFIRFVVLMVGAIVLILVLDQNIVGHVVQAVIRLLVVVALVVAVAELRHLLVVAVVA